MSHVYSEYCVLVIVLPALYLMPDDSLILMTPLIHLPHPLIHPLIHSPTLTDSKLHIFINLLINSQSHPTTYLIIHSSTFTYIHMVTYSLMYNGMNHSCTFFNFAHSLTHSPLFQPKTGLITNSLIRPLPILHIHSLKLTQFKFVHIYWSTHPLTHSSTHLIIHTYTHIYLLDHPHGHSLIHKGNDHTFYTQLFTF